MPGKAIGLLSCHVELQCNAYLVQLRSKKKRKEKETAARPEFFGTPSRGTAQR